MKKYILAIDQGTTGSTAMIFDHSGSIVAKVNHEFTQYFPYGGWVEHDPEEIWQSVLSTVKEALSDANLTVRDIASIGITNQRETSVFWDRNTGKPYGRAIVWQCRRSAGICGRLKEKDLEEEFHVGTGLVLDPYFSGTKIAWMMENDPEFARLAAAGDLCFGTIDSWVVSRLTGGRVHVTDYSNASRTLMFNITSLEWDRNLLSHLGVPAEILPSVVPCSGVVAETSPDAFLGASIPIGGMVGDQQAALFGQACFRQGMSKNTYGTGSFVLVNTGETPVFSRAGMLTTIAWKIGEEKVVYALEGAIFISGAAIQWLRDGLRIIDAASQTGPTAEMVRDTGGVYFVPALVGLGAPYWDPYARGIIVGITRGTSREQIVRATVESMAYQSRDVIEAMQADSGIEIPILRVDGGASVMDLLLSFQANLLGVEVQRPRVAETTALGSAFMAGLAVGFWKDTDELTEIWQPECTFSPTGNPEDYEKLYRGWKKAVERSLAWEIEE